MHEWKKISAKSFSTEKGLWKHVCIIRGGAIGIKPGDHILIVDDDIGACDYLARLLKQNGYRTDTVCDGTEAAEYLAVFSYDLVIMGVWLTFRDFHQRT